MAGDNYFMHMQRHRHIRAVIAAVALGALVSVAPAAGWAQEPRAEHPRAQAEALLREATEKLLLAIELMIQVIPQYELPEITEDGDIIIRRKRPGDTPPPDEGDQRRI